MLMLPAYGKLNLVLDVLGRRPDGYHDMRMLMLSVSLCDEVSVTIGTGGAWHCNCDRGDIPSDEDNLALRAAHAFFDACGGDPGGIDIYIRKRIPSGAGMAGGSSDAAAVLRALDALTGRLLPSDRLRLIGASVGSDVPYCLLGGMALAEGRGETLTPLPPMPPCSIVLLKPTFSVSTPKLFAALDEYPPQCHPQTERAIDALKRGDLSDICAAAENVFQPILTERFPIIDALCGALRRAGAMAACLTGTGSVVYGVFSEDSAARRCAETLADSGCEVFLTEPV